MVILCFSKLREQSCFGNDTSLHGNQSIAAIRDSHRSLSVQSGKSSFVLCKFPGKAVSEQRAKRSHWRFSDQEGALGHFGRAGQTRGAGCWKEEDLYHLKFHRKMLRPASLVLAPEFRCCAKIEDRPDRWRVG